ncbi:death-associated inhibitor of apoptosis 1-like [Calliphora vicina]|uniref:death-associated inhibitor of apoptosis 1-like n=1 Tax=Calliphora vicina TaxID=7373 RepID=UPI00325AAE43
MACNALRELPMLQPKPITHSSSILRPQYRLCDRFKNEDERLQTFDNWPLNWLDKNILAATGMFYTGDGDKTKCYFCEIMIGKWELQDDPVQEHLRWSPNCPLLKRRLTSNVPINNITLDQLLPPAKYATYDTPPIQSWKTRPSTDYSIKAVRLQTFVDWPRSMKQKPAELAEAGFYYMGVGDSVKCFSCQGGLKDWEVDDDPWEQHALWMGDCCSYVKLVKGEAFIKNVVCKFKNPTPNKILAESGEQNQLIKGEETTSAPSNDYKSCKICFDKECNTAYIPCGHVVACAECSVATKDCPLCRGPIQNIVRIYLS